MSFWNPVIINTVFWGLILKIKLFGLLSLITALVALYPPYILSMVRGEQTPPRSTWFLWLILDAIAFGSRLANGNFDALLFAYTTGTVFVAAFTIPYGKKEWTNFETACAIIVFLAIIVWAAGGRSVATVCALAGITVAMLPLLIRVLRGKYENLFTWCVAPVTGFLNLLDGQIITSCWIITIQLCVLLPLLYYWKWLPRKQRQFTHSS